MPCPRHYDLLFPESTPSVDARRLQWVPGTCLIDFVDGPSFTKSRQSQDPALRSTDDLEIFMERVMKYEHEIQVLSDELKTNNDVRVAKKLRLEIDTLKDFKKRWSLT